MKRSAVDVGTDGFAAVSRPQFNDRSLLIILVNLSILERTLICRQLAGTGREFLIQPLVFSLKLVQTDLSRTSNLIRVGKGLDCCEI